jgi:hypothetical protein
MLSLKLGSLLLLILNFILLNVEAQYLEEFSSPLPDPAMQIPLGWGHANGDGQVEMEFFQSNGYATILVDAKADRENIWWALVKVQVPGLDIKKLMKPEFELRVEARIRTSHAPRRVNLHFNHQRTTDYHSHLMEYDIPNTWDWHIISMTTKDFDVKPGDRINAQLALMDWGNEIYRVDIDYFKVDVVNRNDEGKDLGEPLEYHPALENPSSFKYHLSVVEDAIIDSHFPDRNFNDWRAGDQNTIQILATGGTQIIILRWDMEAYKGKKVNGSGLLELITHSLQRASDYQKDFGMIRISEILAGDPEWDQKSVTYNSFRESKPIQYVINTQMIIDSEVSPKEGSSSIFTISRPVLQRLIDGKTLGLAILPLGAVNATFKSLENENGALAPKLHFNLK